MQLQAQANPNFSACYNLITITYVSYKQNIYFLYSYIDRSICSIEMICHKRLSKHKFWCNNSAADHEGRPFDSGGWIKFT